MTTDDMRPHLDVLSLTDIETFVFEAVATLEYTGQPTTREHVRAVVNLDDATTDATLRELASRKLLTVRDTDDGQVFEPANRGWSTAPEQGQGM